MVNDNVLMSGGKEGHHISELGYSVAALCSAVQCAHIDCGLHPHLTPKNGVTVIDLSVLEDHMQYQT